MCKFAYDRKIYIIFAHDAINIFGEMIFVQLNYVNFLSHTYNN